MRLNELYNTQIDTMIKAAHRPKTMRRLVKEAEEMFANHPSTASLIWIASNYKKEILKENTRS